MLLGAGQLLSLGMAVAGGFLFWGQQIKAGGRQARFLSGFTGGLLQGRFAAQRRALNALTRRRQAAVFGRLNRSGKIASGHDCRPLDRMEMEIERVYMVSNLFELRAATAEDAFGQAAGLEKFGTACPRARRENPLFKAITPMFRAGKALQLKVRQISFSPRCGDLITLF